MYGHILVALKSDPSDDTLAAHAAGLARLTKGRLTLFHAVHSHTRDEGAFLEDAAAAYLAEHARKLAEQGLVAEAMIMRSSPAAGVRGAARERAADLLSWAVTATTRCATYSLARYRDRPAHVRGAGAAGAALTPAPARGTPWSALTWSFVYVLEPGDGMIDVDFHADYSASR